MTLFMFKQPVISAWKINYYIFNSLNIYPSVKAYCHSRILSTFEGMKLKLCGDRAPVQMLRAPPLQQLHNWEFAVCLSRGVLPQTSQPSKIHTRSAPRVQERFSV